MRQNHSAGFLKYLPIFLLQLVMVLMTAMTQNARADEAMKTVDGISTFFLKNGMQVVAIPDHRAPVVTHMVWYRVGAADERPGKSGIAHFLEHLMFKGTKDIKPGDFSKIVARNGGQDNAFTSQDYTGYYQRIARDRLELVMKMEADRMRNLTLTDKDVLPERDVILEERRMRIDNDPSSRLSEQVSAALYVAHPYGKPIIGWENEMAGLTRKDALTFYRKYYAPNNAVLIVAGDVEPAELKTLATKYYGGLKPSEGIAKRVRPSEPVPDAERRVVLRDKDVRLPTMRRSYLTPSYTTAAPGEAEALSVLSELLGEGATSRLYTKLVVERKIASGAGSYFIGEHMDNGVFMFYGMPTGGKDIAEVEKAIDEVIAELLADGVTEKEVEHAKKILISDNIYSRDSQSGMARMFGAALTSGQTVEDVLDWPDRIEKVTAADVTAAARKYLRPENSVTGILLRAEKPAMEPAQ
ncbi:MAG: peptidase M16 [Hyphomicrobiales bacterium]|nr:MAG: peptidase M16 [Hyphomicrobiales bacterium]